jgi:hypothetical protein
LPLLSLTLARLYINWIDVGGEELTLANYESMGGMRDVVNHEIEQILSRDSHDRQTALGLLRSALIPWLATINPNNDQLRWLGIQRYGGARADFDLGADPVA